ncbi:1-aminocyclopropane-1-carboxylate deaminase/D-cysteine desulfhydrase [Solimonas marina]|uniref:Pyridoxal-phosphate dependent enzyme n=1 Tax=Solimonas marina TaxID=2714601 RepID=A0A970B714_9GAMM|nr:pyridoxal-phosphate dependent enzyme [Solimonas marina]NKF23180.1 pyridoxal-phosphate dependent enzyme [Solimonas marina]
MLAKTSAGPDLLVDALPSLASLPRAGLVSGPTPIEPLAGLPDVYLKRDDLTATDYGGNKIRKLDYLLADALARGRRTLTVFGYAGSNFVAATSWHARKLGLQVQGGLLPQRPAVYVADNLSISLHCGTDLFLRDADSGIVMAAAGRAVRSLAGGRLPYWIPPGGSNALGALGFVAAAFELQSQIEGGLLPCPAALYVPFSSMGTVAGLCVGLALAGLPTRIEAVQVVSDRHAGRDALGRLIDRLARLLRRHGIRLPQTDFLMSRVSVRTKFYGGEYALATPTVKAAMTRFTEATGARSDSAYSGKALACLFADRDAALNPGPALYWHTFSATALPPGVVRTPLSQVPDALKPYWAFARVADGPGAPPECIYA